MIFMGEASQAVPTDRLFSASVLSTSSHIHCIAYSDGMASCRRVSMGHGLLLSANCQVLLNIFGDEVIA